MSNPRDSFLDKVRQAVRQGNRPGDSTTLSERGQVGYQGAGGDLAAGFRDALSTAGGMPRIVPSWDAAVRTTLEIVQQKGARKALLTHGPFIDPLNLGDSLRSSGIEVTTPHGVEVGRCRDAFFAADIGITGVDYLIAETGSVVHLSKPADPRSGSLLPPIHIALADSSQILPDLFDLFDRLGTPPAMPSGLTLITGPSKTGDIELRLVTGVHGPGEIHVIVVSESSSGNAR